MKKKKVCIIIIRKLFFHVTLNYYTYKAILFYLVIIITGITDVPYQNKI